MLEERDHRFGRNDPCAHKICGIQVVKNADAAMYTGRARSTSAKTLMGNFERVESFQSMTAGDSAFPAVNGRWVPRPRIPVYPVLSSWRPDCPRRGGIASTLDQPVALWTENGRFALYWALRGNLTPDRNEVLCPSYHCLSMVAAIRAAGGQPVYYSPEDDLSTRIVQLEKHVTARTAAVIVVHFFGFLHVTPEMRAWADAAGLVLVEDCAHAFYGGGGRTSVGRDGHYAISSVRKFLPVAPGGLLSVNTRDRAFEASSDAAVPTEAIRALVGAISLSRRYGRLARTGDLAAVAKWSIGHGRRRPAPATATLGTPSGVGPQWDLRRPSTSSNAFNRFVTTAVNRPWLAARRREIYQRVIGALGSLHNVVPLQPNLPPDIVPYMVPFRVQNLSQVFEDLEDAGMPMLRFGQFLEGGRDAAKGAVARAWSRDGLQLPCHQGLSDLEVETMLELFLAIVGRRAR